MVMNFCGVKKIAKILAPSRSALKKPRNAQSRHSRNVSRQVLDLLRELFIHAPRSVVHRSEDQILQHLLVFARKSLLLNFDFRQLFLPVHLDRDHSAAGACFHANLSALMLEVFLHLPQLRHHLLQRFDFHFNPRFAVSLLKSSRRTAPASLERWDPLPFALAIPMLSAVRSGWNPV